jgi:hypothetical protein
MQYVPVSTSSTPMGSRMIGISTLETQSNTRRMEKFGPQKPLLMTAMVSRTSEVCSRIWYTHTSTARGRLAQDSSWWGMLSRLWQQTYVNMQACRKIVKQA